MKRSLVHASAPVHNATKLCSSPTSYGPDLIDVHGYYCDMETKVVSPLCTTSDTEGCINLQEDGNLTEKRSVVRGRGAVHSHKRAYAAIDRW